ncbi:MAG: tetratricopeptide repeat protein [Promethearchaeota archaeon]
MPICHYCKREIETDWNYCHYCNKPLITNVDIELDKRIQQSHDESPFYYSEVAAEEENYETHAYYDEEIEDNLEKIEQELAEKEQMGESIGDLLLKKASLFYKKRDFESTMKNLELALRNFNQDNDLLNTAISHNEIGLIHEERGYFEQAIYSFDSALSILKQIDDQQKVIQVLNNLGNVYYALKEWEEAYNKYQAALDISEKLGYELDSVRTSSNLVEILFILKDYDRIIKILKRNENFFKENENIYGIIQTRIKFGKLYYYYGEVYYDQSYKFLNEALALTERIKDQVSIYDKARLEWECYLYLGKLNLMWDNDTDAEDFFLKSLSTIRTFEIQDHIKEGIVLEDIASFHALRGEDESAIEYYDFASEIYEKFGDKEKVAELSAKIGKIYNEYVQNKDKTIEYYQKALSLYENLNSSKQAAIILERLGDLSMAAQDIESALDYLERAKLHYEEIEAISEKKMITEKINSIIKVN